MTIDPQTLIKKIQAGIADSEVRIEDLRDDGQHYAAYIVSPAFAGKTRVEQHRMVHDALKDIDLCALSIQTSAPKE